VRGAWTQKLYLFIVLHISIWGAWSFVWGAKPTKAPRSDGTACHILDIPLASIPPHGTTIIRLITITFGRVRRTIAHFLVTVVKAVLQTIAYKRWLVWWPIARWWRFEIWENDFFSKYWQKHTNELCENCWSVKIKRKRAKNSKNVMNSTTLMAYRTLVKFWNLRKEMF